MWAPRRRAGSRWRSGSAPWGGSSTLSWRLPLSPSLICPTSSSEGGSGLIICICVSNTVSHTQNGKSRIIQLWRQLNTVSVKIFLSLNLFISGNETRIHGPLGDGARRQDCLLRGKSKHREKVALNFCGGIVSISFVFSPL